MCQRRIGDPLLVAGQLVTAIDFLGAGLHAACIGAVAWFGQAHAAYNLTIPHTGQEAFLLLVRAVHVDRRHDEARLHSHGRAEASIDALHLPRDQTVGDVGDVGATVVGQGCPEEAEFAELFHDFWVEELAPIPVDDKRGEFALRKVAGGVPDLAFILRQLIFQQEGVFPGEIDHVFSLQIKKCPGNAAALSGTSYILYGAWRPTGLVADLDPGHFQPVAPGQPSRFLVFHTL